MVMQLTYGSQINKIFSMTARLIFNSLKLECFLSYSFLLICVQMQTEQNTIFLLHLGIPRQVVQILSVGVKLLSSYIQILSCQISAAERKIELTGRSKNDRQVYRRSSGLQCNALNTYTHRHVDRCLPRYCQLSHKSSRQPCAVIQFDLISVRLKRELKYIQGFK